MAQASAARRAAEQAARERLAGPLISAVGELGVAVAQRQTTATGVVAAEERRVSTCAGRSVRPRRWFAAATAAVAAAEGQYRQAHQAALDAGWAAHALTDMVYPPPDPPAGSRSRRRRTSRSASVRELTRTDASGVEAAPDDEPGTAPEATAAS